VVLFEVILHAVPGILRVEGQLLAIGILWDINVVDAYEALVGDNDILLQNAKDKDTQDGDRDYADEGIGSSGLHLCLLLPRQVAAPAKDKGLAITPALEAR